MKNTFVKFACLMMALCASASAFAEFTILEDPYEVTQLRITMLTPDTGRVLVKKCDTCPDEVLEITPATKFFKADREITLAEAVRYLGQEGVVFRAADSRQVTRIRIY